jgi:hypothetical protein
MTMRQYRYVIAASDGTSHDFTRHEQFMAMCFDLPELLADGWKPVRETPMGQGTWFVDGEPTTFALVLILLEKKVSASKQSPKKTDAKKSATE